ncbi:MAG: DUF2147 domain-containing protein [Flavobacteriales bacterium]|jgi:uncharacterized protein (DUF2147 family)|nr:DUF2147 domain-containing protein [Flavobacteriales bacterium]MDG1190216.1 DUF2147 domain-containing protein [Flavobacteriales bacterium]|tara:strand:- start:2656 stop:3090 length:435 start_codon:yes stop_codon:yes gene_type:complete
MKSITLLFGLLFSLTTFAQSDAILGEWYTADKDAVVTIFTDGKTISGKTTWMEEPNDSKGNPKLDKENPDENLRSRKRMGLKIMQDFVYKGDNVWEDGKIYKPSNGKTYGGTATLVNKNTLELEGYLISLPFIGKTSTWTRKTD